MSRIEKSKKAAQKSETKKLAPKPSASKKHSGELNDEQLDRIAGGAMSYSYHNQV
jgi:hypothetical protein